MTDSLGPGIGRMFLVVVAIAIASCSLTVQTGAVRLVYAMARDGLLPNSRLLSKVGGTSKTPAGPAVIVGLVAASILLVNLNHPQVVEAVGSVSVVWINLAYLWVTAPLLFQRLKGWPPPLPGAERYFRLGRWGLAINCAAVLWGVILVINTGWPRESVYGKAPFQRFLAPIGTIALLMAGLFYYNRELGKDLGRWSERRAERPR